MDGAVRSFSLYSVPEQPGPESSPFAGLHDPCSPVLTFFRCFLLTLDTPLQPLPLRRQSFATHSVTPPLPYVHHP